MLYQIQARVTFSKPDGYSTGMDFPTFYLDSAVQGIMSLDHAARIAVGMFEGLPNVEHISVTSMDPDCNCHHVEQDPKE